MLNYICCYHKVSITYMFCCPGSSVPSVVAVWMDTQCITMTATLEFDNRKPFWAYSYTFRPVGTQRIPLLWVPLTYSWLIFDFSFWIDCLNCLLEGDSGTNVSSCHSLPRHHQRLQQCPLPGTCKRLMMATKTNANKKNNSDKQSSMSSTMSAPRYVWVRSYQSSTVLVLPCINIDDVDVDVLGVATINIYGTGTLGKSSKKKTDILRSVWP